MKPSRKSVFPFLLALSCIPAFFTGSALRADPIAHKFYFDLKKDDVYIVEKYQDIAIRGFGNSATREEKNKISLNVTAKEGKTATLSGSFFTYSRTPRLTGSFKAERDFYSDFTIDENGRYVVSDRYVMPNLRSLPVFPDRPLLPGETWDAEAEETIDFENTKIKIPLTVHYTYTGRATIKDKNGNEVEKERILYRYSFEKSLPSAPSGVVRISGFSADELYFDLDAGIPFFDTNRLSYRFLYQTGNVVRYAYRIDSWYKKIRTVKEEEKTKIAGDLKEDLKDEKEITVRKNDEGIVLDMNAVFFETDSAKLMPGAKESLGKIAEILKRFPDREIRISGHTDSTGTERYNLRLSEERAKSVLDELKEKHGIDGDRMSYRGYGERKPVSENATPEGRAKNRRVEILIVTE